VSVSCKILKQITETQHINMVLIKYNEMTVMSEITAVNIDNIYE